MTIDLSDNTDAGFYAEGSVYSIWLIPDETVDGIAVTKVLASFTIGPPDVNIERINDVEVTGTGVTGDKWRPA